MRLGTSGCVWNLNFLGFVCSKLVYMSDRLLVVVMVEGCSLAPRMTVDERIAVEMRILAAGGIRRKDSASDWRKGSAGYCRMIRLIAIDPETGKRLVWMLWANDSEANEK